VNQSGQEDTRTVLAQLCCHR